MTHPTAGVTYRLARPEDMARTYEIAVLAQNHLAAAHNFPQEAGSGAPPARALAFRRSALEHDGGRYWLAEVAGQTVGFGIAVLRGHICYLAALHVMPAYQGQGIGHRLLNLCMGAANAPGARIWTAISDSLNPVSNGLYARFGMYAWVPLVPFKGDLPPAPAQPPQTALYPTPATLDPTCIAALGAIDEAVYGVRRDVDHTLWLAQPDMAGFLFGRPAGADGYAYISDTGRVGPLALRDGASVEPALSFCLTHLRAVGAHGVSIKVPGLCRAGLRYLLRQGLHSGRTLLILASEPFGQMDRYVPSGSDALL